MSGYLPLTISLKREVLMELDCEVDLGIGQGNGRVGTGRIACASASCTVCG